MMSTEEQLRAISYGGKNPAATRHWKIIPNYKQCCPALPGNRSPQFPNRNYDKNQNLVKKRFVTKEYLLSVQHH